MSIVMVALLLVVSSEALAQKVGTSSLQFLKVMPTARATAMGEAFAALPAGADAVFWNPAGLTVGNRHEVVSTLTLWLFGTKQGALGYALPIDDIGTIGMQVQYVDFGTIEETRVDQLQFVGPAGNQVYNPGLTGTSFSPSTYLFGLSFARQLTEAFSAGVTVKYVRESLYNGGTLSVINPETGAAEEYKTYATVWLFDFGITYNTGFRSIRIGAAVQNFGSQVRFAREDYPAPLTFRLGAAADIMGPEGLFIPAGENRLTVAYDIHQPNDYAQQMHVGMEYAFQEVVALRAGYKSNYDNDGLTLGAGVKTGVGGVTLAFDYSYGSMGDYLAKVHRISLGVLMP